MNVALLDDVARPGAVAGRRALTAIFERILERPVGLDDDFFEIGGTSMAAISLILEIETLTGQELSIAALYNAPTVRLMAALLAGEADETDSLVIVLREGPARPCLFMIHGVGGTAIELRALAKAIELPLRIYGVQAAGLDGREPNETIEAMAASYVREMLSLQPDGPYFLAGFSVGGMVAFEMARALSAMGRTVAFLGMIDTYPVSTRSWRWFAGGMLRMARAGKAERRREITKLIEAIGGRARGLGGRGPAPVASVLPASVQRVRDVGHEAVRRYRPSPLDCDVTFFQAMGRIELFPPEPRGAWRTLVRDLTIERVPGSHLSLVIENAALLARAFERRLRPVLDPR